MWLARWRARLIHVLVTAAAAGSEFLRLDQLTDQRQQRGLCAASQSLLHPTPQVFVGHGRLQAFDLALLLLERACLSVQLSNHLFCQTEQILARHGAPEHRCPQARCSQRAPRQPEREPGGRPPCRRDPGRTDTGENASGGRGRRPTPCCAAQMLRESSRPPSHISPAGLCLQSTWEAGEQAVRPRAEKRACGGRRIPIQRFGTGGIALIVVAMRKTRRSGQTEGASAGSLRP